MMLDDLLNTCRRYGSERVVSLVTADPTDLLLSRGADHRPISRNTVANTPLHPAAAAKKRLPITENDPLTAGSDLLRTATSHPGAA
jgi:hypothetical protein